ncbi:MAG: hypothetical protein ACEQSR_15110, partial [Candidatus Methylacidiphilales bacterium]
GVVTSINGSVRYVGDIVGMASHAGTTPMDRRRDAATAAAELALFVEKRASAEPHLVGTVGMLEVPSGMEYLHFRVFHLMIYQNDFS